MLKFLFIIDNLQIIIEKYVDHGAVLNKMFKIHETYPKNNILKLLISMFAELNFNFFYTKYIRNINLLFHELISNILYQIFATNSSNKSLK